MVKLFKEKLSFEDKQKIVRVVVEKVVATPLEATIYGRIPIIEGIDNSIITVNENEGKVGFESKDSNLQNLNQHITTESSNTKCLAPKNFTSGKVGFELKDWNCRTAKCWKIDAF